MVTCSSLGLYGWCAKQGTLCSCSPVTGSVLPSGLLPSPLTSSVWAAPDSKHLIWYEFRALFWPLASRCTLSWHRVFICAYFWPEVQNILPVEVRNLLSRAWLGQRPHGCCEQSDPCGRSWQSVHDLLIWHLSTQPKLDLLIHLLFFFLIKKNFFYLLSLEFSLEYYRT